MEKIVDPYFFNQGYAPFLSYVPLQNKNQWSLVSKISKNYLSHYIET